MLPIHITLKTFVEYSSCPCWQISQYICHLITVPLKNNNILAADFQRWEIYSCKVLNHDLYISDISNVLLCSGKSSNKPVVKTRFLYNLEGL